MLNIANLVHQLDQNTKVAKKKKAVEVAGKRVELAATNLQREQAVEDLKEAQQLLKQAKLENTPLFVAESSYMLKCHQGDEVFPCVNSQVCSLCKQPERPKQGVVERGYHLNDDRAVWICDRYGHPKVIGCQCPKCTTEQGCKFFYFWDQDGKFPIIGKEKQRNVWLPAAAGYEKHTKIVQHDIVHYTTRRLLPVDMYEESFTESGMCSECLYSDHRLQCPAHIQGDGYWILKRHYPQHLEWALDTFKPKWQGKPAPMLLDQHSKLQDERKLRDEEALLEIDKKLLKDRVKRILATEAPPDRGEGIVYSDLNNRLSKAVNKVHQEWNKVIEDKTRTAVLGNKVKKGVK